METATFQFKRWRKRSIWMAAMFTVLGLVQIQTLWISLSDTDAHGMEAVVEAMPFSLIAPPLICAMALGLFATLRPGGLHREYLRLDAEGLTYGNIFRAHRWPWADLSAFAVGRRANKELIVTFTLPGKPGWTVNHLDDKAMIEDVYDTPLEDIATTLNEFRNRALQGDGADISAVGTSPLTQT